MSFDYQITNLVISFNQIYSLQQIIDWLATVLSLSVDDKAQLDPRSQLPSTEQITVGVRQISLALGFADESLHFLVLAASITFEIGVFKSTFTVTVDNDSACTRHICASPLR